MESLSNGAKRKKRKTRKCLDEIRKRSRRTGQILFEKDDGRFDEMFHNKNIQKCMLTSNRLTLRMFPKAIQSKTITRPVLLDLEHKPNLNLDELVRDTNIYKAQNRNFRTPIFSNIDNNGESFQNKSHNSNYSLIENSLIENEQIVKNCDDKEDLEMFSSMDELNNKSPISMGTPPASSMTSSSTQSLREDNGYNLYEEFMSEIPACLQQNSKLIQEDVMKKTKMLLQNLFIESCYEECEDNILRCIKNDKAKNMYYTSTEVVHNPIDYIRQGHVQHQTLFHNSSESISGSDSASQSPLRDPSCLSSPSDTTLSIVIQDTPDYTYYPHRLN
ncbi:unnamed protein product [Arctia plantaginis]|uniref:Uncharacterized protein n=1 Tax=Arctia plantaginis TaxID=874455 RepID=A0A8S0ZSM6_ARCPL|nr:unnamed protein product [Arctia plantaginis]